MSRYANQTYALLRIMSGFMFSFHGAQKILGFLAQNRPVPFTQIWFGGIIELSCGFLVMIGFFLAITK